MQQREKTKELHRRHQQEEEKKKRKVEEYRETSAHLKGYPDEDVRKAHRLVSTFKLSSEQLKKW